MTTASIRFQPLLPPELEHRLRNLLKQAESRPTDSACFESLKIEDLDQLSEAELRYYCTLLVLRDLVDQGWKVSIQDDVPYVTRPKAAARHGNSKNWYREILLRERNKQLAKAAVSKFIQRMERPKKYKGQEVSIRDLIAKPTILLANLDKHGPAAIRPYVQVIDSKDRDVFTGYRLMDIWRYFRLTWSLPHKATPGRSIYVLIRDAGLPNHPVMGIVALGNSIVQITCRDDAIGWTLDSLLSRLLTMDSVQAETTLNALWAALRRSLDNIRVDDLVEGLTGHDDTALLKRLTDLSKEAVNPASSKRVTAGIDSAAWVQFSETPLFRRKRAREILKLRQALQEFASSESATAIQTLRTLASNKRGRSALGVALQAIKKEKIGTNMMDIIVCGGIPPYNELLAGKLASLLVMSPEVTQTYEQKYASSVSVIASQMKGEPILRDSRLVFLGTTSLYETGSSQYNRLALPVGVLDGRYPLQRLTYQRLGFTKGFGTVYFADETVDAISQLITRVHGSQMVSNTYGAGTSPRLRLIRSGLDLLGLPADELLRHNFRRIVYGIRLAENTDEFLRGEEDTPRYCLDQTSPRAVTDAICRYWRERWLSIRLTNDEVMERVRTFDVNSFMLGGVLESSSK